MQGLDPKVDLSFRKVVVGVTKMIPSIGLVKENNHAERTPFMR